MARRCNVTTFFIKKLQNPDVLDYCMRNNRGEFSIDASDSFDRRIKRQGEIYQRHPEFKMSV